MYNLKKNSVAIVDVSMPLLIRRIPICKFLSRRPHPEAEGGGYGDSIGEHVLQMGEVEPALEVPLELGLPTGVAEVDRRAVPLTTRVLDLVLDDAALPNSAAAQESSAAGSLVLGVTTTTAREPAAAGGEGGAAGVGDRGGRAGERVHGSPPGAEIPMARRRTAREKGGKQERERGEVMEVEVAGGRRRERD